MNLFQLGEFTLSSGEKSNFKIECDALTDADIGALAYLIRTRFKFKRIVSVPTGGDRLFHALVKHRDKSEQITLVVDDVLTSGKSIERVRRDINRIVGTPFADIVGVVLFARSYPLDWVYPIFQMW